jgi:hypothetical protein
MVQQPSWSFFKKRTGTCSNGTVIRPFFTRPFKDFSMNIRKGRGTGSNGTVTRPFFTRPFKDFSMNNRKGQVTGHCATPVPL